MTSPDIHDALLMNLAQACGSIDGILDAFFGFLSRKTDFFILQTPDRSHMGFPAGVAEKMVARAFRKHIRDKNILEPAPKSSKDSVPPK